MKRIFAYLCLLLLFSCSTMRKAQTVQPKIDTTGFYKLSEPTPNISGRSDNNLLLPPTEAERHQHGQVIQPHNPVDTVKTPILVDNTPEGVPVNQTMKVLVWLDTEGGVNTEWGTLYAYIPFHGDTASIIKGARAAYAKYNVEFTYSKAVFEAWQRVSTRWTHTIITPSSSLGRSPATPTGTPYQSGVSWVGSAIVSGMPKSDWVFSDILSSNTWYITAIVVHEVGHTLGLSHQAGLINGVCSTYGNGFWMGQTWYGPGIFVVLGYFPGNCVNATNSDTQKLITNVGLR